MNAEAQTPPPEQKRGFWRTLFVGLLWIGLVLGAVGFGMLLHIEAQLPDVERLKDVHLQEPMRVLDRDGGLIAQYGEKRRIPLTFDQIPKDLIHAVLATEDARFYEHPGVDMVGLARAAVVLLKSGRKEQGASTITMQVARNFYLSRKKTFSRKIREILLALKIDRKLSKDRVLSLYLNKIFFGNRAYGVGAAAAVYYGKPIQELNLAQIAMLAGLPQSPSRNNPIHNPVAAKERRNHVLQRMYELQKISKEQYEHAIQQPITASYHSKQIDLSAQYVAETVQKQMLNRFGEEAYEKGLTITTSIDPRLQRAARKSLQTGLIDYSLRHGYWGPENHVDISTVDLNHLAPIFEPLQKMDLLPLAIVTEITNDSITVITEDHKICLIDWNGLRWARRHLDEQTYAAYPTTAADVASIGDIVRIQYHHGHWRLAQWPKVQGALVAIDPKTNEVLAMMGGFNAATSAFNRVTQAKRQPGSNFKPFIYSAGLSKGLTLASIINDAPIVINDSGENSLWRPMNDTKKFYGPTRVRQGLIKSRNIVSIRILEKTGIDYTIHYLKKFGFQPSELPHSLSLALGSAEITPYQLARAYKVFASGGYLQDNQLILSYRYQGKDINPNNNHPRCPAQNNPSAESTEICTPATITAQNNYLMTQALQDVIRHGTGRAARVLKRHDLGGKTGTTNDQIDAWFSGFNSDIVTVVWVGYDDLRPLKEYGSQAALPIWIDFMREALKGKPEQELSQPDGIITMRISRKTGEPTDSHDNSSTMLEYFRKQYAPKPHTVVENKISLAEQTAETADNHLSAKDSIF